jgi:hypothetical protein
MRLLPAFLLIALLTAGALAAIALAGGGPPPQPGSAPGVETIVAHGSASARVRVPAKRSNRTIERAVRRARFRAFPRAVASAREEALVLARAAGLELAGPLGASREVSPPGFWDQDAGRFGPGRWCGRIFTRRTVRGRRVTRSHHACPVPRTQAARIAVTFAVR